MTNLIIRNSGFETGDTRFWEAYGDGVLIADDSDHQYGLYCGRVTYNTSATDGFVSSDYHAVGDSSLIGLSAYIRHSTNRTASIVVFQYDGDYNLVRTTSLASNAYGTGWNIMNGILSIESEIDYIRIGILSTTMTAGCWVKIDSMHLVLIDKDYQDAVIKELLDAFGFAASFDTSADSQYLMRPGKFFVDLDYVRWGGSAASIVINIMESGREIAKDYIVGTYTITDPAVSENVRIECALATGYGVYIDCIVTTPAALNSGLAGALIATG